MIYCPHLMLMMEKRDDDYITKLSYKLNDTFEIDVEKYDDNTS